MSETLYVFIVDTEEYSGNFEREMCAYMTGVVGECEVGEKQGEDFREKYGDLFELEDHITSVQDEHGTWRPCAIEPTPGWYNTGGGVMKKREPGDTENRFPAYMSVAIFFDKKPTDEMLAVLKERAHEFAKDRPYCRLSQGESLTVTGLRLIERVTKVIDTEISV